MEDIREMVSKAHVSSTDNKKEIISKFRENKKKMFVNGIALL